MKLTQIDNASEYIRENIDRLKKDIEKIVYEEASLDDSHVADEVEFLKVIKQPIKKRLKIKLFFL
jgi:hypothetical protein